MTRPFASKVTRAKGPGYPKCHNCRIMVDMGLEHGKISGDRRQYDGGSLHEDSLPRAPKELFEEWLSRAFEEDVRDPNAMVLSTVDGRGAPSNRVVLAKAVDDRGIVFYTNYESRKANEIEHNRRVALLFHWRELDRVVRIEGRATRVSGEEADAYFYSRPPGSNVGAMVSPQSQVIASREELLGQVNELAARVEAGEAEVVRPNNWGGYLVVPAVVEFWQGRADRLHDRIRYRRDGEDWIIDRLAP